MFERTLTLMVSGSLAGMMILGGCASSNKTASSNDPSWTAENPLASKGASDGASNKMMQTSSLDALRSGESTATAASSPMKDIHFEFDRYDLHANAREVLKANTAWLKENPSMRVQIEGHCDERGANEYNMSLGAKRAQAAKDYMVSLGIAPDRLSTVSYGEEIPACNEHVESCWQQNRRDRFVAVAARPTT